MSKNKSSFDFSNMPTNGPKSYFEYNRENQNDMFIDEKENAIDSLETSLQFLYRKDNLKWKWFTIALHHSLYSFCISALVHGNYAQVLSVGFDDDKNTYVEINNQKPYKSNVVPFIIKNHKTPAYRIKWNEVSEFPQNIAKVKIQKRKKEKLISFWSALARIQDNYYWMNRELSTAVEITDVELEKICWFSENMRNDFIHFIPKSYIVDILRIIDSAKVFLKIIEFLVFNSFSIHFMSYENSKDRIKVVLDDITKLLIEEEKIIKHLDLNNTSA